MSSQTTMGELAARPPDDNKKAFLAIVDIVDRFFPENWREWKIHDISFRDLFGADEISSATEIKLRFAIPTLDLARAFNPTATSLSERAYRAIRNTLVHWPFGRALMYAPHRLMEMIHEPSYDEFMNAVKAIKPVMLRRRAASMELSGSTTPVVITNKRVSSPNTPAARPNDQYQAKRVKDMSTSNITEGSSAHLLASVLGQQTELFNKMIAMQAQQNRNIEKLIESNAYRSSPAELSQHEDLDGSFESQPDSTNSRGEEDGEEEEIAVCTSPDKDRVEVLRSQIAEAQRKLAELQNPETTFDFTPSTVEREPKITKAEEKAVMVGRGCQRLGQSGWYNVRFTDTQKQFQATPIFTALKPNNLLASVTPKYSRTAEILERADLTLGAITHGLIQHRLIFQNLLDNLPSDIKKRVGVDFVEADSSFRKSTDALIQYTCGRRAEVIKERRDLYKPKNVTYKNILRDIPPSDTHLFEEKTLSETVKELGGINKIFPPKRGKLVVPRPAYQQESKDPPRRPYPKARYGQRDSHKAPKPNRPFRPSREEKRKPFFRGGKQGKEGGK
ncbi:uncharacterized protein LOC125241715 [Leguminivora glycinivorella]|uniref:uncharacterized protein LOC125241715 n=1 Tax=Leguminivora glycinivorella TaxID=1035111 RepID=UPI00200CA5CE|nr:uncharacterized protein LOC125241715 [Leguminivora glycinivorella]